MFGTICGLWPKDGDFPERCWMLGIMRRVLEGSLYENLPFEFHEERTASGEYIPLRQRRPSVRYALASVVVQDSVSLLFSDGHFPVVDSPDADVRTALAGVIVEAKINALMTEAAIRGSVGSVALLMRVLAGRVFASVLETEFLTPVWDRDSPDVLVRVTERTKVSGWDLVAQGYEISDPDASYWFGREWGLLEETWFVPQRVGLPPAWIRDDDRSVAHRLGFVPIVWIRNLPGGRGCDGACTFRAAVETGIEIDYQLSQAGRGLKYSSDPTLLIREPAGVEGTAVRGAANALVVSEKGDAKLLEIGGTASQAVIDYVRILREFALESVHGNRVDSSRLTAPASGRAIEMMNQGLIWLADNLRTSYGDGLLELLRMVLRAASVYAIRVSGTPLPVMDPLVPLSLRWPHWYPENADAKKTIADTVTSLVAAKHMSRDTAMRVLAPYYGVDDSRAETARIEAEESG